MEFAILGPLAVRDHGANVAPTAGKPRALLVRLLVAGGRPVPADRLIEDLWDGNAPRSGAQTLQTYILQLRKSVGADRLVTDGGGYRLVVHEGELDAAAFEGGIATGRKALSRGATADAIGAFERALQLWRGTPLADAGGAAWAQGEAARLEELRLVAQELLFEAKLAAGQDAEVVAAAEAAVAEHPLRERLWAHLITALYRQGRQADALRAFQRLRTHLADELGIDPSPELRDLEQAVLEQSPQLGVAPAPEPVVAVTATLPSGLVTFLLTDVVGSTRLWDTVPRLMPDALALHDNAIRDAVESHGGVVLKARGEGDSAFAVFGRATDAANAAVASQQALGSLDWPEGCALSVRMAVHTGEALERDGDYYGPTVNRAARLRALARGGQIVVSHATADVIVDHLGPEVRLVELGPQQLRDLERPETVYLLVDADAAAQAVAGLASQAPSLLEPPPLPSLLAAPGPFVGREQELERLTAEWECVQQGTPRVVMLGGEPGVGKTRLAAEIARRAHDGGAFVLYGRCDEDLGAPYQPFAEALRLLLPSLDASALRAVRGVEELARLVPEVADVVPDLPAPTRSDPDTERYALFDTVARLFVAVSKDQPILVVLDDLHWAAKPTLLMLRHVLRFGEGAHLQLLGTYRTTELDPNHPLAGALADLHRDGTVERVVLAGLDETDVTALLEATGHDDDELARTLSTVTSGNPFFLIEVLRHVAETGGRWDPHTLPQGVREAVGRRLTRLTDETRDALLAGAVAGAQFSLELIEEVLGHDLLDEVGEACGAGILVEESRGQFRFNHALVRQSLLTGVASVKRVRLHQRIAQTLETAGAETDERLADLAHHYFESAWAGNAAKAVEYCRRAADQAMARLAYEGAAELYERAVQAFEVDEATRDDGARAELLLARCEAHLAAGDAAGAAAALADLERAAAGSRALGAWVVCYQAQLAVLAHPDQLDEMEHRVAAAAEEFAALGDAAGEAVAHNTRASCLARLGRFAACELALDRALTAARQSTGSMAADHRRVNAVLAGAPSAALWGPNPVARAGGRCLDVIRLLRITTGSPAVEATSVRCQAMLEAFRGREQAARRMLESTRRTLAELGLRHALLEVQLYEGVVDLLADDAAAAAVHLRRAYDGLSRMGLDADAAEAAALLARACLALGDGDEAEHLCVESERLGGQDLRASIAWRTVRAALLARRGEHQRAREVAEAAVALAEPTDALVDQGDAYLALAIVLDAIGDHDAAVGAANEAVARYERKGASALAERARQFAGTATSASAGLEHGEEAPAWLPAGAFIAMFRRYNEIFAARAWAALGDVVHPDVSFDNRRRLTLQLSSSGIAAYADFLRGVADDMGYGAVQNRYLAARGWRLVLAHTTVVGHDHAPDTPTEELWNVLELSEDGRLAATVVFDVEDLDAAYAELDARYLAGDGAEHADVFRAIADALDAYNRRDPASAPMEATLQAIDHRPASVVAVDGAGLWSDFEGTIAQVPDSTLRLAAVHALEGHGAVVTTVNQGSTTDGVAVERIFHGVHLVEDGRITRVELYPETELDAAVARFRELRSDVTVSSVPDNVASTMISQIYRAAERHDWSALGALVADDFLSDDRRWGMATRGRAALLESLRASFDRVGEQRLESTTFATRGEHLALARLRVGDPGESAGAPELEILLVVAADRGGQLAEAVSFEPDEIDAAVRELNARYLAGEGAPYEATLAPVLESTEVRLRDWDRWVELLAPDVEFVDHRSAALGVVKGRDAVAEALAPNPNERNMAVAVEAVDHGVAIVRNNTTGTSADGLEAEWPVHAVWRVVGGLVKRLDVFEPDDLTAAQATFDELRRLSDALPPEDNAAARAHRETYACMLEQRWADLEQLTADDVVVEDRRAILRLTTRGRRDFIEVCRAGIEAGFRQGDTQIVATRGDRLVLTRTTSASGDGERGAPANVSLWVTEIDAAGRVSAAIGFDADDVDAAVDELNARYLAGEGAPFAETLAPVFAAPGLRSNEWGRWVELLTDDVSFVDRRPASFGVIEGRDPVVQTFGLWNERGYTVRVEAVGDGVVLALNRAAGMSADGMEAEWLILLLYVVEHGRLKRFELFRDDDLPRARAAFEQLRGRAVAPPIADNAAATALSRYQSACARRDWAAVELLLADDVVADERRSGAHIQWNGPAALIEATRSAVDVWVQRFECTTMATRGSRLALVEVRGTGNDPQAGSPELGVLDVVELDAQGRISAIVAFDDDDLDAAVAELNARYLAGEGAPYADTLGPVLEAVAVRTRDWDRWIDLMADDLTCVDHRLAALGVIEGRDAVVELLDPQWNERGRTVAVEAVDHGLVLTLDRATGSSADGVTVEWLIRILWVVEDGLVKRFDIFECEDFSAARATFDELRQATEAPSISGNAAAATWARYHAACARQDWPSVEPMLADDVLVDDRRAGAHLRWDGRAAVMDLVRSVAEIGVVRFDRTTLATRGSCVALVRTRGGGRAQGPGDPELEVLDVVEVDAHGRIVTTTHFDVADIDAAFAELDARYLAGEGAPYGETLGPVLEFIEVRGRNVDRWVEMMSDDLTFVDHRQAAFGVVGGRDAVVDTLDPRWDEHGRLVAVGAIEHGIVLVLVQVTGTSADGVGVEWLLWVVYLVEKGLVKRFDVFERDDLSAARATFDELRRPLDASPIRHNTAATVFARYQGACTQQDWAAVEALLAGDVIADDRRSGARIRLEGRAALVDAMRGVIEVGVVRFDHSLTATRGSRLALVRVRGTGLDRRPGARELEVLDVVEVDAQGRVMADVTFELDDVDAAFAELDARYLAGEGAPYAATVAPTFKTHAAWTQGGDRWPELLAEDITVVDHRSAAFGVIEGRPAVVETLGARWSGWSRALAVEAVEHGVAVELISMTGTSPDGAEADWLVHVLYLVADGLITRFEVFELDDLASALAAFEGLQRGAKVPHIPDNSAARAIARFLDICLRGEWAMAEAMVADDLSMDDRRSGVHLRSGREEFIAAHRFAIEVGVTGFETTTVATRGDRLVLTHEWCGTDGGPGGAPVVEMLQVVETDAGGQIIGSVGFDVDDFDSAFAEIDRRYLAGDGAPYAGTMAVVLEGIEAEAQDRRRWAEVLAEDVKLVDHRRAAFGVVEGRDVLMDLLWEQWARRTRTVVLERIDHGVALVLVSITGESRDGGSVEWLIHDLCVVEDGFVTRIDIFELDDLEGALAMFDELHRPPDAPPVADNMAMASLSRLLAACLQGDWTAAGEIVAEDIVADDLRSGIRLSAVGRESSLASLRFGIENGVTRYDATPIATRGDRLALTRLWSGSESRPGAPVVELLYLVESDAHGQIISTLALDLDDLDSAFAEIDRRYLAGEGAPRSPESRRG